MILTAICDCARVSQFKVKRLDQYLDALASLLVLRCTDLRVCDSTRKAMFARTVGVRVVDDIVSHASDGEAHSSYNGVAFLNGGLYVITQRAGINEIKCIEFTPLH